MEDIKTIQYIKNRLKVDDWMVGQHNDAGNGELFRFNAGVALLEMINRNEIDYSIPDASYWSKRFPANRFLDVTSKNTVNNGLSQETAWNTVSQAKAGIEALASQSGIILGIRSGTTLTQELFLNNVNGYNATTNSKKPFVVTTYVGADGSDELPTFDLGVRLSRNDFRSEGNGVWSYIVTVGTQLIQDEKKFSWLICATAVTLADKLTNLKALGAGYCCYDQTDGNRIYFIPFDGGESAPNNVIKLVGSASGNGVNRHAVNIAYAVAATSGNCRIYGIKSKYTRDTAMQIVPSNISNTYSTILKNEIIGCQADFVGSSVNIETYLSGPTYGNYATVWGQAGGGMDAFQVKGSANAAGTVPVYCEGRVTNNRGSWIANNLTEWWSIKNGEAGFNYGTNVAGHGWSEAYGFVAESKTCFNYADNTELLSRPHAFYNPSSVTVNAISTTGGSTSFNSTTKTITTNDAVTRQRWKNFIIVGSKIKVSGSTNNNNALTIANYSDNGTTGTITVAEDLTQETVAVGVTIAGIRKWMTGMSYWNTASSWNIAATTDATASLNSGNRCYGNVLIGASQVEGQAIFNDEGQPDFEAYGNIIVGDTLGNDCSIYLNKSNLQAAKNSPAFWDSNIVVMNGWNGKSYHPLRISIGGSGYVPRGGNNIYWSPSFNKDGEIYSAWFTYLGYGSADTYNAASPEGAFSAYFTAVQATGFEIGSVCENPFIDENGQAVLGSWSSLTGASGLRKKLKPIVRPCGQTFVSTAAAYTLTAGSDDKWLAITGTAPTSLTVNFPPNPDNGDEFALLSSVAVASGITLQPSAKINGAITSITANGYAKWLWSGRQQAWLRIG